VGLSSSRRPTDLGHHAPGVGPSRPGRVVGPRASRPRGGAASRPGRVVGPRTSGKGKLYVEREGCTSKRKVQITSDEGPTQGKLCGKSIRSNLIGGINMRFVETHPYLCELWSKKRPCHVTVIACMYVCSLWRIVFGKPTGTQFTKFISFTACCW
jgi:hypothetical protein